MVPRFRGRSCPYLLPVRDPLRPSADPGCGAVDGVDRTGPDLGRAGPFRRRCHRVRHPPVRAKAPLAWWFMGAGVLLFITGDTIYKSWHQIMGQNNIPFPSFVDAIYIAMYPVLAVGFLLLARSRARGGDHASLLDGLIITVGVGLLSWIFLIGPNVRAPGGLLVRFTAAAYPLGDILLLAMLAHLWSAGGLRTTAGRLLAIGTLGTLVADSVYGLAGLHTGWNWHDGNPFDLGWILFYSCWGAAALHPSMRELSEPRLVAHPAPAGNGSPCWRSSP